MDTIQENNRILLDHLAFGENLALYPKLNDTLKTLAPNVPLPETKKIGKLLSGVSVTPFSDSSKITVSLKGQKKLMDVNLESQNQVLSFQPNASLVALNNPPVANSDSGTTNEDTSITFLASNLLKNDSDIDGDILKVTSVSNAVNGSVVLKKAGKIIFTPKPNFNGNASFEYTISDGKGGTAKAVVNVLVNGVNDAPVAVADSATMNEDAAITLLASNLLKNDSDLDGDTLKLTSVSNAINGSIIINNNGNVVFRPKANFNGNGSFEYTVSDGKGGTSKALVNVLVKAINDAPVAVNDSGTTSTGVPITFVATDLLKNDSDLDGDSLKLSSVENAINGSVVLNAQGNPVFTPNANFSGDASFNYVISDNHGGTAKATVKVLVNPSLTPTFPDLSTKFSPTSAPSLPSGTDFFAPSFVTQSGTVNETNSPIIAEWTRTGANGETIVLTGTAFDSNTKFWVYGQTNNSNGVLLEATIQKLDGDVAALTLPNNLPAGSSYLLWAQNATGYSKPVMINQTETWWVQETAGKGQVASIFGRNLSQDGGTQKSHVYLEDSSGKGSWAEVVAVNPYKVDFKVPEALANGNYKVFLHNGDGGSYGWSKPLTITVNNGLNYTGLVFNVKDFGAKGDGVTDDAQAIQAAIREADKHDMATVYLPTGTYITSESLFVGWDKVRWMGDGKDATTLKAADGFDQYYLFEGGGREQITFQNLTLDANYQNAEVLNVVTNLRFSSDLQYLNVKIEAEGTSPFDWHGSNRVSMKDSEVIGQGSFLGTAKQVFIDGTQFFGTGYTNSVVHGFGTQMLSITNSTAQNLDTSDPNNGKWAKGRFFTDQSHWGVSQNQYFGNNETIDMAPPPADDVDRNSGEQIMWETEGTVSFGAVTAATKNTVTFVAPYSLDEPWQLTIVNGKGIGQSRALKSFNSTNKTYEIQEEWNVLPDQSSIIIASKIPSNIVVYNNKFDGTSEAYNSPTHIASAGVQAYHGAANMIVDNNTFHELRAGVSLWSGQSEFFMPAYFTQVSNNTFQDNLTGISFPYWGTQEQQGVNILGTVTRNNSMNNVDLAIDMNMYPSQTNSKIPNTNMNVFENNTLDLVGEFLSSNQGSGIIHNNILLQNNFV